MSKPKNYKITISKEPSFWQINLYTLKVTPIYEHGNPNPVRHDEEWVALYRPHDDDIALFYWEARLMAWRLKLRLERGTLDQSEKTIYEKKE
jgi:hypothetical protein